MIVRLAWRAAAFLLLVLAIAFAAAGVALLRSKDPATALGPFAIAGFLGWCEAEIYIFWKSGVGHVDPAGRNPEGVSAAPVDE